MVKELFENNKKLFRIRMKQYLKHKNQELTHLFDVLIYVNNNYDDIQNKINNFIIHLEKYYI